MQKTLCAAYYIITNNIDCKKYTYTHLGYVELSQTLDWSNDICYLNRAAHDSY